MSKQSSRLARLALVLFAFLMTFALFANVAGAASTYFEQTPGIGAINTTPMPLISVKVSDPAGISTGFQMKIDGVTRTPKVKWGPGSAWVQLSYQPTSALANGNHTVYASVFTGAGRTSTTWSFTQKVPPVVGPLTPADGSTVDTQKPTISAVVSTSGSTLSSYAMTVDGTAVDATYNAATKTVSYTPFMRLANDRDHTVTLTATDAGGATTTVTWSFYVQIYASMVDTQGCTECHATYPTAHPMDDCWGCHDGFAPFPAYWNMDNMQQYAHGSDYLVGIDCAYCHASQFPSVPRHPENLSDAHITDTDMSGCSCHVADLTTEHNRYLGADGNPITCASCHDSADPAIQAGMAAGTRMCPDCHTIPDGHPYADIDHVADVGAIADLSGKTCSECHDMDLMTEHEKTSSSSAGASCATCHESPRDSFGAWNQTCSQGGCHEVGTPTAMHGNQETAHAPLEAASACAGAGCHTITTVDALHVDASLTVGTKTYSSCTICHRSGITLTKDCATCHPDRLDPHGYEAATHSPSVTSGDFEILGASFGTHNCAECHATLELGPVHGGQTSCDTCHSDPVDDGFVWDSSCASAGCHDAAATVPQHGDIDAAHTRTAGGASDGCFGTGCHAGGANIAEVHGDAGCDTCHGVGVTPTADCATAGCHNLGAPHADLTTPHTSSGGSGFVSYGLSDGDHDLGWGSTQNCSDCHTTELMLLHANYCGACHADSAPSAVKAAVAAQNTNCTACHPGVHTDTNGSHEGMRDSGCDCHDNDWSVWGCTDCHGVTTPAPAPSTTSDAKASYIGDAVIHFTAHDNYSGSFGIRATYYSLDGGAPVAGTQVTVPAPAAGTVSHTLSFWSVDWSGNVEVAHPALFTVAADSFPPVTTSNVVANKTYAGDQTFTLTATDANSTVAGTWWQLDGTSGTWNSGTSVPVAGPASGTASHTLYWYSRDSKGNTETTKSVAFSIVPGKDFTYTGAPQTFVVPAGVTAIAVTVDGASGGNSVMVGGTYNYGGPGGRVTATIPVTPGSTLTARVGGAGSANNPYGSYGFGGWPNGGRAGFYGGGGGGSSSLWLGTTELAEAGGGGGSGSSATIGAGGAGGAQGTLPGGFRTPALTNTYGAGGGGGGWNAGAGATSSYRGGTGGTSYIAAGSGAVLPGANSGNGSIQIRYLIGSYYTLTYNAGTGGSISGTNPQAVVSGGSGSAVTAVAAPGYHFVDWSDGVLTATRTDSNVTANQTVTANFAINTYTLTYSAGANGSISGTSPQTVSHGGAGTAVTAVADAGFRFVNWSDGVLTANRTDTNVTANKAVTANFTAIAAGATQTTTLNMSNVTWVDANDGASGAWATYSIYVNDVLIGVKNASADPTWSCPELVLPPGSHIDIVTDCGFSSYGWIFDEHRPDTYTITLPANATGLSAAVWGGFPNINVGTDWWDDYDDTYTGVWVPTSTISNITYTITGAPDTEVPTGSISVNSGAAYTNSTTVSLGLSASDTGGSGLTQMRFSNDNTNWSTWETYAATRANWTISAGNGAKTVYVQYRDGAGNISASYSDGITLDGAVPTGSISVNSGAAYTNSTTVSLGLSASDTGGSGLSQMRFSNDNSNWSTWEAYAATRANWTINAGNGAKTVYVQYRDGAGNVSTSFSDAITLDGTPPVTTSNAVSGQTYTGPQAFTLSPADTGGSGVSGTWWQLDSTAGAWTSGTSATVAAPVSGTVSHTLYWYSRDNAGNQEVTKSVTFDVAADADGTTVTTSLATTNVTWVDANDGASGAWANYKIYVNDVLIGTKTASADPTWNCPQMTLPAGSHIDVVADCGFDTYSWTFDEHRPDTYTLTLPPAATRLEASVWTGFSNMFVGTDYWDDYNDYYTGVWMPAGNITNIKYRVPAGTDLVAPTGSISVNSGAAYTNSTTVSLGLSASDTGGSGLSQMRFSNDNTSWSTWEAYAATKANWTLTSGNGAKTVYVQYRDVSGNVSTSYSDAITLDGTAPTGSVTINGGAASTSSTSVSLGLSATDSGGSSLYQMRFSNDNSSWSTWEGYATSKSWTLTSGDGAKTVYVQYRDNAGNISSSYSDGITLASAVSTATLAFRWEGWGQADLHVEDASGTTIASTFVEGSGSDLNWYVTVPAGASYRMVADYWYDYDTDMDGSGDYSTGVVTAGQTVEWWY